MATRSPALSIDALITPEAVAGYLGITTRCLQKYRTDSTGPAFIELSPRCIRYRWEDVQAFLKARTRKQTTGARLGRKRGK